MQFASFFGFYILSMHHFLLNAESEYRVKVMNDMFTHPGWLDMSKTNDVHIVDRWMNIKEKFDAKDLLSADIRIVTNGNVEHKIRQAHQFLSCKYAKVLIEFCSHEKGIGTECRRMDNPKDSLNCLGDLLEMLKISDSLVLCMRGSLSCLHQLSPQTVFEQGLYEILEDIKNYKNITFDRDLIAVGDNKTVISIVAMQTAFIEKIMTITLTRISAHYNSFCWPIPWDERNGQLSFYARRIQHMSKVWEPNKVVYHIKNDINKTIELFMDSFDKRFGFKYNSESKTTSLMYDPELLRRVKRISNLLKNPGWLALNNNEILVTPYRYETVTSFLTANADGKIVTKENVDEKVQIAHHFLTCNYAETLKRCCDYTRLIWKQYKAHFPISSIFWIQFKNTIIMSEPLVSRMQDALSYFYELSPHMEYNRDVFDILEDFKNYIQFQNFDETIGSGGIQRYQEIKSKIIGIIKRLVKFSKSICISTIQSKTFIKKNAKVTLSNLEKNFKQEIHNFTVSNYQNLGFIFDTTSKMKNKVIEQCTHPHYKYNFLKYFDNVCRYYKTVFGSQFKR